jgi:hypothetical protein
MSLDLENSLFMNRGSSLGTSVYQVGQNPERSDASGNQA